ncbi:hypothetical protein GJ744_001471 [Endocarpon pusillum]|uniref:Peptidase A2 domain-containing protein n=1 Tax=Endocarpon pusillum TaxID=364733 RepID=A0A8H7E0L9_9EURO|nr:hypothetical protein GJ744_001471 [Endocarpon pusillum]
MPARSDSRIAEQPLPAADSRHQCSVVKRSNTAPASYGYVLPIATAQKITSAHPNEVVDSLRAATIHIHPDREQPDLTELCRCTLDTGSDFNLVSERTLHTLKLPFTPFTTHEVPELTGLGGVPILPIGSVLLKWHMDRHKGVYYQETFYVISEAVQPLFDVLLGKEWLEENRALVRNNQVILACRPGWNRAASLLHGDAQTVAEES